LTESPSPGGTSTSASLGRSTPDTRNSGGIPHNDFHNEKTVKPAWNEPFTNQEGAGGDYQSGAQDHQPRHDEGRMKSSSARRVVWGVRLERSVVRELRTFVAGDGRFTQRVPVASSQQTYP
jgi:hypothetical protein